MINYDELTQGEFERLLEEGDPEAIRLQAEFRAEIQAMVEAYPPNSLGAFLRDLSKFKNGDMEAGMRLSKTSFTKGRIFFQKRLEILRDYINLRHTEEKTYDVWWNEEIVIQALQLVLSPELDSLLIGDVYGVTRNNLRQEIEKDLTGGHTLDSKERSVILLLDNPENQIMTDNDEDLFNELIASLNSYDPNAPEEEEEDQKLIDLLRLLIIELDKLSPQERKVVSQLDYGDTDILSKELGKTPGAIRTWRNRIMQKIKKAILKKLNNL